MNFNDLTGMKFHKLTVISLHSTGQVTKWNCLCDCGKETVVQAWDLKSANTKSCGCYRREFSAKMFTTHGKTHTPGYNSWLRMNQRCSDPNDTRFHRYGGRGISVCERWKNNFENFLSDMGKKPPNLSIDRIDNDGNYEPSNCRWATAKQQNNNKSNNKRA